MLKIEEQSTSGNNNNRKRKKKKRINLVWKSNENPISNQFHPTFHGVKSERKWRIERKKTGENNKNANENKSQPSYCSLLFTLHRPLLTWIARAFWNVWRVQLIYRVIEVVGVVEVNCVCVDEIQNDTHLPNAIGFLIFTSLSTCEKSKVSNPIRYLPKRQRYLVDVMWLFNRDQLTICSS